MISITKAYRLKSREELFLEFQNWKLKTAVEQLIERLKSICIFGFSRVTVSKFTAEKNFFYVQVYVQREKKSVIGSRSWTLGSKAEGPPKLLGRHQSDTSTIFGVLRILAS